MRSPLILTCISLLCLSAHAQQGGPDITKIMTYFVASSVVAEKCLNPTEDEKSKFAMNLLIVTAKTKQAIKDRSPGKSEEVLNQEFEAFHSGVRKSYADALEKAGCDSSLGRQGSDLWRANVNWQPPG